MKFTDTKPSIVFCHGLWADGSCFSKVIVPLQAEGHECIAAQYGLNSTAEDVALTKAAIGPGQRPCCPCRPLLRRKCHHGGWNGRARCRLGLHLCARPGRGREFADAAVQFPEDSGLLPHRGQGRTHLVAPGGYRRFRRRFARPGKEARLGDAGCSETRPVRRKSWRNRLEIETKLVHHWDERSYRAPRHGTVRRKAHGRHCHRGGQQSRPHAVSSGRGDQCHSCCGKERSEPRYGRIATQAAPHEVCG